MIRRRVLVQLRQDLELRFLTWKYWRSPSLKSTAIRKKICKKVFTHFQRTYHEFKRVARNYARNFVDTVRHCVRRIVPMYVDHKKNICADI